ncbi:DEAD/DEAH box helicase [Flavobacteriaceae bacterium]|jgi:ATP-dependent RNA helicase DeaD|nr:DEAD/DEAH box helicase [Flavobacteriaceae bacterium]MDA9037599.1 DEAD/DEAH box helicase [Flavobacteriaceae bacterium]MDA9587989.1 DEAD/DEAH box helicase [Flavobacteriaceae bacterium]MDA9852077.1 DEAD/DEAH box helicase [Flavobacteriaceae bacterium]MDC0386547.1 DEAD/DEAH box helicase [Flavobacteriaceae bacterium]
MTTFKSLGLNTELLSAVEKLGFEAPTEVQEKVIPLLLEKSTDLVALAQTGTGKTAAFGFPMLQKIDPNKRVTQGLILSPTRELCLQITNEIGLYGEKLRNINIVAIYGGANITEQAKKIKRGAQIVVATPGRLKDMIRRKLVDISAIEYCVLDEADEMLNMGFYEDIKSILTHTPKDKSSWLFSATMPKEVSTIAKKFMHDPIEITVGTKNSGAKNVNHQYFIVGARERYNALKAVIGMNPAIFGCVFCRTKIETQKVAEKLIHDGYKAAAIHGDLSQNQRDAVMQSFRKKKIQLLIATDVAARGIDVDDITHVVNYQLPDEIETYTHRSGRTGRAGKLGTSVLFVTKSDRRKIKLIENKLQTKLTELEIPKPEEVFQFKMTHWVEQIKTTPIKSDLHPYLSKVVQDLEGFSKEELIELFLSKEFQTFNFNAKPLEFTNESSSEGRPERTINASKDKDRFFINVGARDQYDWQNLKDFLRSFLKLDQDDVFQVEVMKNFSFFSTHNKHRDLVLKSFQDLVLDERKVNVELTKKGKTYSPKKQFSKGKNKRKSRF